MRHQAWYAEFLLEIDLKYSLIKTGARLNLKIKLISLHIGPDPSLKTEQNVQDCDQKLKLLYPVYK
jgi:hypothetical protein